MSWKKIELHTFKSINFDHNEQLNRKSIKMLIIIISFSGFAQHSYFFLFLAGEVGDWKNHFTVAQSEMFDKIIEQEMKDLMFKPFVYSL